jgi:endonuclease/exonuclease/phosphatase family metal-dependent hydrolase
LPGNVAQRFADRLAQLTGVKWYWCWFMANAHAPGEPDVQKGGGGPVSDMLAAAAYENYASFKEGAAVLSRYPIISSEGRRLPARVPVEHAFCTPGDVGCHFTIVFESRVALGATIDTPGGKTQIVTTHLSNGITDATTLTTLEQMSAVLEFSEELAQADPPARRFITCDCNVTEDAAVPVVSTVTGAGWTDTFRALHPDATAEPGFTGGSDIIVTASPKRSKKEAMFERIDYVFWRAGTCASGIYRSRVFMDASAPFGDKFLWPSDHFGVLTNVSTRRCAT